jgi:DNA-binding GntR family transcriptional regulator
MIKASARAYEGLRQEILAGTHAAGSWLREEELAASLGVSRTPVREALQRLQAEGLVELVPNRGAQVSPWSDTDLDDIFELRALLEGYAARRAAEAGSRELSGLLALCEEMEQRLENLDKQAYNEITELNLQFHRAVHLDSANRLLPGLLSGVIQVPLVRHTFHHYTPAELARSFAQHRELIEALGSGDGNWAESVMRSHVLAARASLRGASLRLAAIEGKTDAPGDGGL